MGVGTSPVAIGNSEQQMRPDQNADLGRRLAIAETMLAQVPDGIALFDANSRLVSSNAAFATLTQLPPHVLQPGTARRDMQHYSTIYGLFGPVHEFAYAQAVHENPTLRSYRLRHDGRMMQMFETPCPDGSFVVTLFPINDLLTIHRDVAERSAILQAVMSHARCGIVLIDSQGGVVACNEMSRQFNPYPKISLTVGTNFRGYLARVAEHAAEQNHLDILHWCEQAAALDRTKPAHDRRPNLRGGWVDFYSDPTADGGFIITHIDVTELVNARLASETTTQELQALIAAMPGALIRQRRNPDGSWNRFFVSAQVTDITGHSRLEASDPRWVIQNTDPADYATLLDGALQAYAGGQSAVEFRFRHRNAQWIWIRAMMRGYSAPSGDAEAICVWSDITHEHALKAELTQARHLSQMGEVATGMAHEMNQPLSSISIAAENARRALERLPHSVEYLDEKLLLITNQAHRAAMMIDQVQSYTRRLHSKPGIVKLKHILADVVENAALTLEQYQAELVIRVPAELPDVIGHGPSLERALSNLVTNACEAYALNPGVMLSSRIITLEVMANEQSVQLIMRDRAGGIADAVLPRIFEPFFTTKPVGAGTGLGLSAAYAIIAGCGGAIAAENIEGGATFNISLLCG